LALAKYFLHKRAGRMQTPIGWFFDIVNKTEGSTRSARNPSGVAVLRSGAKLRSPPVTPLSRGRGQSEIRSNAKGAFRCQLPAPVIEAGRRIAEKARDCWIKSMSPPPGPIANRC